MKGWEKEKRAGFQDADAFWAQRYIYLFILFYFILTILMSIYKLIDCAYEHHHHHSSINLHNDEDKEQGSRCICISSSCYFIFFFFYVCCCNLLTFICESIDKLIDYKYKVAINMIEPCTATPVTMMVIPP